MDTETQLDPHGTSGHVVLDFLLIKPLGSGGQGEVYEAICRKDEPGGLAELREGDHVAIKKLHGSSEKYAAREFEIGPRLRHPNIVRYYGHFFHAGFVHGPKNPFVVMELLRGETLHDFLARGMASLEDILALFRDCLSALQYAQSEGYVHRDIKPQNIFVVPDPAAPGTQRAKLLDFGVARRMDSDTSVLVGPTDSFHEPPPFAGIEGYENKGDHVSDILSVGLCLFQAVAGRLPFDVARRGDELAPRDVFWRRASQLAARSPEFDLRAFLSIPDTPDPSWEHWHNRTQIWEGLEPLFAACFSPRLRRVQTFGELENCLLRVRPRLLRAGGRERAAGREPASGGLADFRLVSHLGSGAHGDVLEAVCEADHPAGLPGLRRGDRVALKKLNGGRSAYVERELEALARLRHENIVRYHGHFYQADLPGGPESAYVVMERLQGETLQAVLAKGVLRVEDAIQLFRSCLSALQYAQDEGIAHRDLKPHNIFIAQREEAPGQQWVKLVDFGVARRESTGSTTLTGGAADHYQEPPLQAGIEGYGNQGDSPSDLLSIGLCLFRAIAGRLPFAAAKGGDEAAARDEFWRRAATLARQPGPFAFHDLLNVPEKADRTWETWQNRAQVWEGLEALFAACLCSRSRRVATFAELEEVLARVRHRRIRGKMGDYELLDVVGQGGFATVFKAQHPVLGLVAAKQLRHGRDQPVIVQRFLRERDVLRKHRTDPMPEMHELIPPERSGDGHHYLIMGFLWGMPDASLQRRIDKDLPIPLGELLGAFCQYLVQLHRLHRAGIFHRDIKPGNLYAPRGNPLASCVFDLGIVHVEGEDLTQISAPATLEYMAFEFVQNPRYPGSVQADLFALGMSLHAALTGTLPFRQLKDFLPEVMRKKGPAYLREKNPALSAADVELVVREAGRYSRNPKALDAVDERLRPLVKSLHHYCGKQLKELLAVHRREYYLNHPVELAANPVFTECPGLGDWVLRTLQPEPHLRPRSALELLAGLLGCLEHVDPALHRVLWEKHRHQLVTVSALSSTTTQGDSTGRTSDTRLYSRSISEELPSESRDSVSFAPPPRARIPGAPVPPVPRSGGAPAPGRGGEPPVPRSHHAPVPAAGAGVEAVPATERDIPAARVAASPAHPKRARVPMEQMPIPTASSAAASAQPRRRGLPRRMIFTLLLAALVSGLVPVTQKVMALRQQSKVTAWIAELEGIASLMEAPEARLVEAANFLETLRAKAGTGERQPWAAWAEDLGSAGSSLWNRDERRFAARLKSEAEAELLLAARHAARLTGLRPQPLARLLGQTSPGLTAAQAARWEQLFAAATARLLPPASPPDAARATRPDEWAPRVQYLSQARELASLCDADTLRDREVAVRLQEWRAGLDRLSASCGQAWSPSPDVADAWLVDTDLDPAAAAAASDYASALASVVPAWSWTPAHAAWSNRLASALVWRAAAAANPPRDAPATPAWRAAVRALGEAFLQADRAWRVGAFQEGEHYKRLAARFAQELGAGIERANDTREADAGAYRSWLADLGQLAWPPALQPTMKKALAHHGQSRAAQLVARLQAWKEGDWEEAASLASTPGQNLQNLDPSVGRAFDVLRGRVAKSIGAMEAKPGAGFCPALAEAKRLEDVRTRLTAEALKILLPKDDRGLEARLQARRAEADASWDLAGVKAIPSTAGLPAFLKALTGLSTHLADCPESGYLATTVSPGLASWATHAWTTAEFHAVLAASEKASAGWTRDLRAEWTRQLACAFAKRPGPRAPAAPEAREWVNLLRAARPLAVGDAACAGQVDQAIGQGTAALASLLEADRITGASIFAWSRTPLEAGALGLLSPAQKKQLAAAWARTCQTEWTRVAGSETARADFLQALGGLADSVRSLDTGADPLGLDALKAGFEGQAAQAMKEQARTQEEERSRMLAGLRAAADRPALAFADLPAWTSRMVEINGESDPRLSAGLRDYLLAHAVHGKANRVPSPSDVMKTAKDLAERKLLKAAEEKDVREQAERVASSFLVHLRNPSPSCAVNIGIANAAALPKKMTWSLEGAKTHSLSTSILLGPNTNAWVQFSSVDNDVKATLQATPANSAYAAPLSLALDVLPGGKGELPFEACIAKPVTLQWQRSTSNPVELVSVKGKNVTLDPTSGADRKVWKVEPRAEVELQWALPDHVPRITKREIVPSAKPIDLHDAEMPGVALFEPLPAVTAIKKWIDKVLPEAGGINVKELPDAEVTRLQLEYTALKHPFLAVDLSGLHPDTQQYFSLWKNHAEKPAARAELAAWIKAKAGAGVVALPSTWAGTLPAVSNALLPDPLAVPFLPTATAIQKSLFKTPLILQRMGKDDAFWLMHNAIDFEGGDPCNAGFLPFHFAAESLSKGLAELLTTYQAFAFLEQGVDTPIAAGKLKERLEAIGKAQRQLVKWAPRAEIQKKQYDVVIGAYRPEQPRTITGEVSIQGKNRKKDAIDHKASLMIQDGPYLRWCLDWAAQNQSSPNIPPPPTIKWLTGAESNHSAVLNLLLEQKPENSDLEKWLDKRGTLQGKKK